MKSSFYSPHFNLFERPILCLKPIKILLFLILCFKGASVYSQARNERDVVVLKNQWILKGRIFLNTSDSIKIETGDENVFSFPKYQVQSIYREKVKSIVLNKTTGFSSYTELGPLASKNTSDINVNTSAFSFQTVNGYQFSPPFFMGLGLGVDLYATQTFIPLFASIRGDLTHPRPVIPFYFVDLGYGFNITSYDASPIDGRGGILYAGGGGVKINFNKSSAFLLSLGYRVQNISTLDKASNISTFSKYERLALRAGFFF